ncbi:Hypothetical protein PHPALM_8708 [Phytophthora palmivora]|uniref:Tc3 transposase DNA binding domain-containing protein n=1 Tax=Phytophthora palmivora TaxID=4796 RepID=A0A2P4Y966_9STRA|nr:Hypothetical protein PHPALM_8708 [Phytophthora palmivora]
MAAISCYCCRFLIGRGKALTNQEHWWIVGLHDGGVSVHEIERRTGRSPTCVRRAVKEERDPQSDTGRQPALTEREVRQLVRVAAAGDKFDAVLKTKLGFKTSVRTVQR